MYASEIFPLPLLVQLSVCSQRLDPRVSDDWQGSEWLLPYMQCGLSCKTTQQLRLRNRQANGWKTSRLIPKNGHNLLHWVFRELKVQIEHKRLLWSSFFGPFLCLCSGCNPCLRLFLTRKCENHNFWKPSLPFEMLSYLSCLWTTKRSPLLTTIQDRVLVIHQRMLFLFHVNLPLPFSFLLLTWRPFEWSGLPAYSLLSHVQKHDLSSM